MALPTGVWPQGNHIPRFGVVLALFPLESEFNLDIQRAPDDGGGDPNVGAAVDLAVLPPSTQVLVDALTSADDTFHYRWRHIRANYTDGAYTPWIAGRGRNIPRVLPPLPRVPLLDASLALSGSQEVLLELNAEPWVRSALWEVETNGSWPDLDDGGETCQALDAAGDASVSTGTTLTGGQTARVEIRFYPEAGCAGNPVGSLRLSISFEVAANARMELDVTVNNTDVAFTARSYLADNLSGVVEFLEPERTFAAKGAITNGDKTLTITDGDLTDEDVGKYISVAGAGPASALLETRIDSVTAPDECELVDAASTTVGTANVILGGGYHQDFDFSGTPGHTETNSRNRPDFGKDTSWIQFRAVAGGQTTNPEIVLLSPILAPTLSGVKTQGHDDQTDIDWSSQWVNEGSANSTDHDLTIQYLVDGILIEQETGVSLDEAQPYLHSSIGEGGLPGNELGSAIFILERKSDNSTLFQTAARGRILTT